jgi:hypothetical protein
MRLKLFFMIKYIVCLFTLLYNLQVTGQNGDITVEIDECNTLFRGYSNMIKLRSGYQLIPSSEYTFEKINEEGVYAVIPGEKRSVTLFVGDYISGDAADLSSYINVQSYEYRVMNLFCALSLGNVETGGVLDLNNLEISVANTYDLCFTLPVSNINWELSISSGQASIKGTGKGLSPEAIEMIKKAKKGVKVKVKVVFDSGATKGINVEAEFIR